MRLASAPYRDAPGLAAVLAALPGARLVGGCVRDALAGLPSADIDLATPLTPENVVLRLEAARLRAIPTGLAHGTVTALADGHTYEVTTLRRDVATDGRHATVSFTEDWAADAARRDFTINAMSMTPDGDVFDYFRGADDLAAGRVRFVGRAEDRVREDFLRILRFFRFWTRYGRGGPDADAVAAIAANADGIGRLSAERIASELLLILKAPDPVPALRLMRALGVLTRIFPDERSEQDLVRTGSVGSDPLLRFAALNWNADVLGKMLALRFSGGDCDRARGWIDAPNLSQDTEGAAVRIALADAALHAPDAHDALDGRIALTHPGDGGWQPLRERIAKTPLPVFPLLGRDLAALGVPPGPGMGRLLASLRAWWRDGGCAADADACRAELARRLSS